MSVINGFRLAPVLWLFWLFFFLSGAYSTPAVALAETINGTGGDDVIVVEVGNATVNGLGGTDTVELPFFPNVYNFAQTGTDQSTNYLGYTLVLNSVEYVRFGTVWQDKTTLPIAAMVSGEVQAQLLKLTDVYLAYFGRAPDVIGLEYWQQQLLMGEQTFDEIIVNFAYSAEAKALFPQDGSNKAFIAAVYRNCFNRAPDLAGWYYWTYILNGGDPEAIDWANFDWGSLQESDIAENGNGPTNLTERGLFIARVLLGAYAPTSGEEDRSLLTNRHEVAMYYVNWLSVQPQLDFDDAINDLLVYTTEDTETQHKAKDVIDYAFDNETALTVVMNNQALFDALWAGNGSSTLLTSAIVGTLGGTLSTDGFTLTVPAGAFSNAQRLDVYQTTQETPFSDDLASRVFEIDGLPETLSAPITLRITPDRALSEEFFVAVETGGTIKSDVDGRESWLYLPATLLAGNVVAQIEPVSGMAVAGSATISLGVTTQDANLAREPPARKPRFVLIDKKRTERSSGGHFEIIRDAETQTSCATADDLDAAFSAHLALDLQIESERTWPVKVHLSALDDDGGWVYNRLWGGYLKSTKIRNY
jgi:hypothetical protein